MGGISFRSAKPLSALRLRCRSSHTILLSVQYSTERRLRGQLDDTTLNFLPKICAIVPFQILHQYAPRVSNGSFPLTRDPFHSEEDFQKNTERVQISPYVPIYGETSPPSGFRVAWRAERREMSGRTDNGRARVSVAVRERSVGTATVASRPDPEVLEKAKRRRVHCAV